MRALVVVAAVLLAACGGGEGPSGGPSVATERPNVVVIVMDTTRYDRLGFNGYADARTPFLDELAAGGVVFDGAMSASSWTAPATASIFTSLFPDQHGVTSGYFFYQRANELDPEFGLNRIPDEVETLPEMMRAAGYRTYGLADNMNIGTKMGFTRGFERFDTWAYEGGRKVNRTLGDWREEIVGGDGPFFLYLQYMDPHKPYQVHDLDPNEAVASARYDAELEYLDGLLAELWELYGLDRDTLVVVTADHGEEFGDHGGEGHERGLYPELVHVPLLVRWDDAQGAPVWAPGRVRRRVSTVDVLPTLRELLDRPAAAVSDGVSLAPLLTDPSVRTEEPADRVLYAHRESKGINEQRTYHSVMVGPYQLIHQPAKDRYMLFDLARDPLASRNLAGSERDLLRELVEHLQDFLTRPRWVEHAYAGELVLDAEQRAELERIGYAE